MKVTVTMMICLELNTSNVVDMSAIALFSHWFWFLIRLFIRSGLVEAYLPVPRGLALEANHSTEFEGCRQPCISSFQVYTRPISI